MWMCVLLNKMVERERKKGHTEIQFTKIKQTDLQHKSPKYQRAKMSFNSCMKWNEISVITHCVTTSRSNYKCFPICLWWEYKWCGMQIGQPLHLAKSQGEILHNTEAKIRSEQSLAKIINKHIELYVLLYTILINTGMDLTREWSTIEQWAVTMCTRAHRFPIRVPGVLFSQLKFPTLRHVQSSL